MLFFLIFCLIFIYLTASGLSFGMWDLDRDQTEPPALEHGVLATELPGKFPCLSFKILMNMSGF